MQFTETPPIKTRPDGSIDTTHYIERGRQMRSEAAHALFKDTPAPARPRRFWQGLLTPRTS